MPDELMYGELATWFPLITPPHEYADEADTISAMFDRFALRPVRRVLELGSGGGHNASHLKSRYEMTLTDLSDEMLAQSGTLNPEVRHRRGDMRTMRLDERFDAVLAHDAVSYMLTAADLGAAIETAFVHLEPGGVALFLPDETLETFKPRTSCGGHDGEERAMRYLEWVHEPPALGGAYTVTYAYALREADGTMRFAHEDHAFGVFPRDAWMGLLRDAGFEAHMIEGAGVGEERYHEVFFAGVKPRRRPGGSSGLDRPGPEVVQT